MNKSKSVPFSNRIFYIFSILLLAFVIYYYSEIEKGFFMLRKVTSYWLLFALASQALTYLIMAFIYRIIIKGFDIKPLPRFAELYKVSVISLFFNQTIPLAGISGNTFIFNFLGRLTGEISRIISVILLELLVFYLTMIIYILIFLGAGFLHRLPSPFPGVLVGGLIVYLLFSAGILLLSKKKGIEALINKGKKIKFVAKYFQNMEKKFQLNTNNVLALLPFMSAHKKLISLISFWQLLTIITDAFTLLCLFYGMGFQISLYLAILVLVCTKIISILPISPGALILYESSMAFLFHILGYPLSIAITITLLFRVLSFWLPMPVGYLLYRRWKRTGPG